MSLVFDFETRSEINLTTRRAYVYAQHPSTIALLASFKLKHIGPVDTSTKQGRAGHADLYLTTPAKMRAAAREAVK